MLTSFRHRSLIKLFSGFKDSDTLYLEIEHCSNGEFSKYLNDEGPLTIGDAKFYVSECVLILEFLHGSGIIHRDFKPENLLLDDKNHLKIIDFGTAKFFETESNKVFYKNISGMLDKIRNREEGIGRDRKGTFVGTMFYLSPEMIESEEGGTEGDWWAFGITIYKMLTGMYQFFTLNLKIFAKVPV